MYETCRCNNVLWLFLIMVFLAGCESEPQKSSASVSLSEHIAIDARILAVVSVRPGPAALANLRFKGGLILTAEDPRFGGLSSLSISADGSVITTISDRGDRIDALLVYNVRGNLVGIEDGVLQRLQGRNGKALIKKKDADAEAIAIGVNGGIVVAFERRHRLMNYPAGKRTIPFPISMPDALRDAPKNGGIEALTRLKDGRLLAITEKLEGENEESTIGWIGDESNWKKINYSSDFGFSPSGATTLPNGDIVVLEHGLTLGSGLIGRLKYIPTTAMDADVQIKGQTLADIKTPGHITNFEGIDSRLDTKGEILIYMISDNDFSALKKTMLLMFKLIQ